jgi:predicted GNAT family N-acyltransferase
VHKIELLAKTHDRDGFDCGSESLNFFLKHIARQHAERGISRTFVLADEDAAAPKLIIGFFSVNICQIKSESLAAQEAKKLPRDVAGVRLGRLAVAKMYRRQGIGKTLLVAAMGKFSKIFNTAGRIGLFVDAKDQKAKRYYAQFGFVAMPSNELELFLPAKTIQEALSAHS